MLAAAIRSQLLRRVSRGFASSSNTVAFAWGSCEKGRLGNGLTTGTQLLPQVFSLPASEGSPVPAIKKISFGHQHTAVLTSSGDVYTHGSGADYVLGHGSKDSEARPRRVEGLPAGEIVDVACGHHHTLAVTRTGAVYSWGWGGMRVYHLGGLGLGSYADAPRPTRVAGFGDDAKLPRIVQVSAGKYHSIARAVDGQVFSWGDGEYGKLGTGSSTGSLVPQPIEFFLPSSQRQSGIRIVHIASGPQFNMAIADDGQLFGFGRNEYGQLGVGSSMTIELSAMESVPTAIALPLGGDASADDAAIADVACGPRHTIACTKSGKVFRWGERLWTTPSAVELKRRVIRVGGGSHVSACLDDRGVLWTWGRSNSMVLATGSDVSESQPRAVAPLSKQYVTDLFAAGNNMAVLAKPL